MSTEELIVYGVLLYLIVFLYLEILRPALTFMIGIVALLATDVISANDALSGFANEQLAIIVLLLITSNILTQTGIIDGLFRNFMKKEGGERGFRFKLLGAVGVSSAFLNNTPLVAMAMPFVSKWCHVRKVSPSKLLIPLSYVSILGGCITLIGTSTNLIVNGLATEAGLPSLDIFDFTYVGLPMLLIGFVYLLVAGPRMIPDRVNPIEQLTEGDRRYFIETHVKQGSRLIDRTVQEGGLRKLEGMFLVEIMRDDEIITPVSPEMVLREGDVLFFAGDPKMISDLTIPDMGLSLPKPVDIPLKDSQYIAEVVLSNNSRLVGKKVQDSDFRARYDGAILAVHRNGEKLWGKIGEIELRAGDVLLVLPGRDFSSRVKNTPAFYLLSQENTISHPDYTRAGIILLGVLVSIGLVFAGVSLLISLSVLVTLALILGFVSTAQVRNSIDYNLILIIAFGLALGKAMIRSGAAERVADAAGFIPEIAGAVGLLGAMFLATNLLASFMTSKAAVAVTLPVSLSVAAAYGYPFEPFILIVAFGGAANFITPIGYQTNLMVYGPGGYKFKDFFKIGLPLTILYLILSTVILGYQFDLL